MHERVLALGRPRAAAVEEKVDHNDKEGIYLTKGLI